MNEPDEMKVCGISRERVRAFLNMSREERDNLTEEKKQTYALAFHHITYCYWGGNDSPDLCNQLWHDLRPKTNVASEEFDPQVALYLEYAKFPHHDNRDNVILRDNPLRKVVEL